MPPFTHSSAKGRVAAAALLLCLLAIPAATPLLGLARASSSSTAAAQPTNTDNIATERKYRDRTSTAWIPPGRYTAIVIATNAPTRRWIVSLKSSRGSFPITVAPAQTTIIPFDEPWLISPNDQARLESIDVPFENIGRETPLAEGNLCLSAWGITENGPVEFVIKP